MMSLFISEMLVLGSDDYVCLAELPDYADRVFGAKEPDERTAVILSALRELLANCWWRVGDLKGGGFRPWNCSIDDALERVEREWRALGREPTLGDVCWFANTPEADNRARQLLSAGYKSVMSDD